MRKSSGVSELGAGELGAGRGAGELGAGRGAGELGAGRGAGELGELPVTARSAGKNHDRAIPSLSTIGMRCHSAAYLGHGTSVQLVSPAISVLARTSRPNRSGAPRRRQRMVNRIG